MTPEEYAQRIADQRQAGRIWVHLMVNNRLAVPLGVWLNEDGSIETVKPAMETEPIYRELRRRKRGELSPTRQLLSWDNGKST